MSTELDRLLENSSETDLMHQLALMSGYEEKVPTITEFMDNPYYLGKSLVKSNGKSSVYPIWRNAACEVFPTPYHTTAVELYLTGG